MSPFCSSMMAPASKCMSLPPVIIVKHGHARVESCERMDKWDSRKSVSLSRGMPNATAILESVRVRLRRTDGSAGDLEHDVLVVDHLGLVCLLEGDLHL